MRNKGFTLIELLAVIVILAIIALIATPIILGIINDSRKSAAEESAKLVVSNFELAYSNAYMLNKGAQPTLEKVCLSFNMDNAKCEMDTSVDSGVQKANITVDIENITCEVTQVDAATSSSAKEFGTVSIICSGEEGVIASSKEVSVKKIAASSSSS